MEQLIMRWVNDGKKPVFPTFPKGVSLKRWHEIDNPIDKWLEIVKYGLTETKRDEQFYKDCNYCYKYYKPEDCYFFTLNGKEVATVTIICDSETKEGYIHMVAATPESRGLGIGNLMSLFGVYILKTRNMDTAYLTTDDWRIPAIKTYFYGGFVADESTQDFKLRWDKIKEIINNK